MSMQGWYGVDLDSTLAEYHGWDDGRIGAPIPLMVQRVKEWLAQGREVRIFTARVAEVGGYSSDSGRYALGDFAAEQRATIEAWCEQHLGQKLQVTASKDFSMIELWDDRVVRVEANTGAVSRQHDKE